jgi:hypothetical protein
MPKRRPGGPSPQNRRRRRRDAAPNLPREQYVSPDDVSPETPDEPGAPRPAPAVPAAGRSVRPTMRRGFVPGAPRMAPPPAIEADYRYVIQDLRQIGVLAAAGIAILVVLSFVLQQ